MDILVINGPNLNLLGRREPSLYGTTGLDEVVERLIALGEEFGVAVAHEQRNGEGELVEIVQDAADVYDGMIINPGAYGHTSVALRDAISFASLPFIEVHVSNVFAREGYRHQSYLSDLAVGVIVGLGVRGYELALMALVASLREDDES